MAELELVTLHEDAERLVLRGPDGVEHTLTITEALRAAVRRDRPRTEALQAESAATLRPREVQARLRAGATAEDLAETSGLPLEHVRRYEWPVITERDHVVNQVRTHHVDPEGKTDLGELADSRLAARGVREGEATWTARREGNAPWHVEVRFTAGERERTARWSFDPKGRVVVALDDEARWLGQPDDPVSPEVLGVPGVVDRRRPAPPDPAGDATARLLDDLAGRRGQRPAQRPRRSDAGPQDQELPLDLTPPPVPDDGASVVDLGARRDAQRASRSAGSADSPGAAPAEQATDEDPAPETGSARGSGSPATEPETDRGAASGPEGSPSTPGTDGPGPTATDPVVAEPVTSDPVATEPVVPGTAAPVPSAVLGDVPAPPKPGKSGRRSPRKGRAQVPSWDEIVFGGARPSS
ncbi:septation protein SepH [Isoptericola halotolerans]|uniref:Arc/MetJ family transcription regulator n=1 Tax=Isoptericola halotolerans TaxID=300560 RepID=A0ABX2A4T4_9MICO|nr:septation protein SepH [Isoptericola halotolerans]NOV97870.1 Arc/MetJ family transcription regulator [Isoptericola halotolerans]